MLRRSLQPRFLVEGIDRSLAFQALPLVDGDEGVRRAELAALEVLDVPIFFGKPGTDSPAGLDLSGNGDDLASQVGAIQASIGGTRRRVRPAIRSR